VHACPESGKELGALFDRFALRRAVRPILTTAGRQRLLWHRDHAPKLSTSDTPAEVEEASAAAMALPGTAEGMEALEVILRELAREGVARELAPRRAFARACRQLSEQRIIRQVGEDDAVITFQFTAERREDGRYTYELETLLTLAKATGKVTCPLPGLATLAQEKLDECIASRTSADVTRVVQRLFERKADLFPIREQGGAYFTPAEHVGFVDRVQAFLSRINGRMGRFPVPAGTPEGDRSVKEAVAEGIASLIAEHHAAIFGFGEDTRQHTLERAAQRIRLTKHNVETYSAYLADEQEKLELALTAASARLRPKVDELA
jgi:hypothetical protein